MSNEELVTAIQNGHRDFITQLWNQCYHFIRKQAVKWANAWKERNAIDIDDLIQSGYFAICNAVDGYSSDKGSSFINYLALH